VIKPGKLRVRLSGWLNGWLQDRRAYAGRFMGDWRKTVKSGKPWWRYDIRECFLLLQGFRQKRSEYLTFDVLLDPASWPTILRAGVLFGMFLLVLGIADLLLLSDSTRKLRALEHDRQLLEAKYLRQKQMIDAVPAYQSQVDLILDQFGVLLDTVPESLEPVHVLTLLSQAAKVSGVSLELFRPMREESQAYYAVLPIEIRLRGDYHALARFMEQVSRMKHLITVDLAIVPAAQHEHQLVLASLLKAYRYTASPGTNP
jgi:type IV pilus assembly protein PilO